MSVVDAGLRIDHVVIGVHDLDAAAAAFEVRYGLAAIAGGRHPQWGTANRLVPLGATYLELVTVIDRAQAAVSAFGQWVSVMLDGGATFGWAVRTDDLDGIATRLGLEVVEGSRQSGEGTRLRWMTAGVSQAAAEPGLPFFIQWDLGTPLPGQAAVQHRAGVVELTRLGIDGDADRIHAWLRTNTLPLNIRPGTRGLTSVSLATPRGPIVVGSFGSGESFPAD